MINNIYLLLFVFSIVLSAFFSMIEAAFLSVSRTRIKHLASEGNKSALLVENIMERPDRLLATVLFGNDFVNTAGGVLGATLAFKLFGEFWGVLISTAVVAILVLLVGDSLPKTFAVRHSEAVTLSLAKSVRFLENIFSPAVRVMTGLASLIVGSVKGKNPYQHMVTEEEIRTMISVGADTGVMEEEQAELLHKVFDFGDRQVHEAMTPRPDLICIEEKSTLGHFLQVYKEHPFNRYPVFRDRRENIVGYISITDVLMAQAQGAGPEEPVSSLMRPITFVPETKKMGKLFNELRDSGQPIAVVVDEFGGVAGIINQEDIVEVLVGQLGDELAGQTEEFHTVDEKTYELDGGMRVEDANRELELGIPEGGYQTIAGFVLTHLGHIPRQGEHFKYGSFRITVLEMKGLKIEKVQIIRE